MQQVLRTKGRRAVSCGFELPDHQRSKGYSRGRTAPTALPGGSFTLDTIIIAMLASARHTVARLSGTPSEHSPRNSMSIVKASVCVAFMTLMISGNAVADNFLDEELSSEPVGGEALVNRAKREDAAAADAQSWTDTLGITNMAGDTTLVQGVKDSFFSGGNLAYGIYADVRRMYANTPDPKWNPQQYLTDNAEKLGISIDDYPAFVQTGSLGEATDLIQDIADREEMRRRIQRMDAASQLFSRGAAVVPDLLLLAIGTAALIGIFRRRSKEAA